MTAAVSERPPAVAHRQAPPAAAPAGFLAQRIVHLHPTRQCNLACSHCYSASGPGERTTLAAGMLLPALALLRNEGYTQVSLSGGEPLVYRPLAALVGGLKDQGYKVTMVSNGLLADSRREPELARLDGLAISFDGLAATHNAVRGRPDAYARACAALRYAAERGRPAAAAISIARDALPELPDLVDELLACGAAGFQIRPVARAGRGQVLPSSCFYGEADRARLVLVVQALRQELPGVPLHCDLVAAQGLWRQRSDYAALLADCGVRPLAERPLSDLANPLVIDEHGTLKPLAYDMPMAFDIATVQGLSAQRLACAKADAVPALRTLVGAALLGLRTNEGFIDWFDHCVRRAHQGPLAV